MEKEIKEYSKEGWLEFEGITGLDEAAGFPSEKFGVHYYPDGVIQSFGFFGKGGLWEGKVFYPSGKLKYEGKLIHKGVDPRGDYYGPTFPTFGKFYSEDGELLYEGEFEVMKIGNAGWPRVIKPENFGRWF